MIKCDFCNESIKDFAYPVMARRIGHINLCFSCLGKNNGKEELETDYVKKYEFKFNIDSMYFKTEELISKLHSVNSNLQKQIDELKIDNSASDREIDNLTGTMIGFAENNHKVQKQIDELNNKVNEAHSIVNITKKRIEEALDDHAEPEKKEEFRLEVGKIYCNNDKTIIGIVIGVHSVLLDLMKVEFIRHFDKGECSLRYANGRMLNNGKSRYDLTELYAIEFREFRLEVGETYCNKDESIIAKVKKIDERNRPDFQVLVEFLKNPYPICADYGLNGKYISACYSTPFDLVRKYKQKESAEND